MRLDMDLVRKIMLALEERGVILGDVVLEIDGYDEETLTYHLVLMAEGGLIDGIAVHTFDGPGFMPRRLTWEGYQFWRHHAMTVGGKKPRTSPARWAASR